jgi:hypothetical protein
MAWAANRRGGTSRRVERLPLREDQSGYAKLEWITQLTKGDTHIDRRDKIQESGSSLYISYMQ